MRDDEPLLEESLTRSLHDAVTQLRAEGEVPELWRARVVREVHRAAASRRRRWRVLLAAAAVMFVVAGATLALAHERAHSDVASATGERTVAPRDPSAVHFTFDAPGARRVALVGDFDAWTPSGRPMRMSADGRTWELSVVLPPGRHAFAFLVDGTLRIDPHAARAVEDDFGVPSSVIVIASRGI
jgi:Glycogen recognition site of AMP-activated protein kinase